MIIDALNTVSACENAIRPPFGFCAKDAMTRSIGAPIIAA
jgi:hypothetical protein